MNFFEVLVALAYAAFADAPVDVAIVEVGLGGSWDATNVIDAQVAVVTPVDLDHTHLLGDDVVSIAEEKSGIIKAGSITVSGRPGRDVARVLLDRVEEVGGTGSCSRATTSGSRREVALGGQQLSLRGIAGEYPDLYLPLHGEHQASNLATALAAVEAFLGGGSSGIDPDIVRQGFADVTSPGRLEIVRRSPTVLVDAAHNPPGARSLGAALEDAFTFTRLVGLVAIFADKEPRDARDPRTGPRPRRHHPHTSPRSMPPRELGGLATEIFGESRVTVERDLPTRSSRP